MPGIISINHVSFFSTLVSLRTSCENINPDIGALPEITSNVQNLIKYREKLADLGSLIKLYKQLALRDVDAFAKACEEIRRTDMSLSKDLNSLH